MGLYCKSVSYGKLCGGMSWCFFGKGLLGPPLAKGRLEDGVLLLWGSKCALGLGLQRDRLFVRSYAIMDRVILPKSYRDQPMNDQTKEEALEAIKKQNQYKKKHEHSASRIKPLRPGDEELYGSFEPVISPRDSKVVTVAIIGQPNTGKSTFLNRLVKNKISSVSSKSQTTRKKIIGVINEANTQVVLIDTPGISDWKKMKKLQRSLSTSTNSALDEADLVIVFADCVKTIDGSLVSFLERIEQYRQDRNEAQDPVKLVLFLNKYDKYLNGMFRGDIHPVVERFRYHFPTLDRTFSKVLYGSSLTGLGTMELKQEILNCAKPGQWMYAHHVVTTQSPVELVNEVIREKIFRHLNGEIPYIINQNVEYWTEDKTRNVIRIDQKIFVQKKSQIKIVLGKNGTVIRAILNEASRDLSTLLGSKVIVNARISAKKPSILHDLFQEE